MNFALPLGEQTCPYYPLIGFRETGIGSISGLEARRMKHVLLPLDHQRDFHPASLPSRRELYRPSG